MGYRAHVNKKHIVEYGEGIFNHCSQALADFLYDLKIEMNETKKEEYLFDYPFYIDDEYNGMREDWEIEKEWLEKAIKFIKTKPQNDVAFDSYTYKEVITNFQYWLDETENKENFSNPDYVYVSWF